MADVPEPEDARVDIPVPAIVVLVGPSSAGKSTWAAANFGSDEVVSSDRLRGMVGRAEDDLEATDDAFALLDAIVAGRARRRLTTVIDTLGLDADRRRRYREVAVAHDLPCVAVAFAIDPDDCRARNRARPRPIPAPALKQQLARWDVVQAELDGEGFHAVVRPAPVRHREERLTRLAARPSAPAHAAAERSASSPITVADDGDGQGDGDRRRTVRFGLHVSAFPWDDIAAGLQTTAVAAERAGIDSLWVMDHVRQIPQVGRDWDPMLEAYAALAWVAAVTDHIRLGALVTPITFRNLGLLAKSIATIDVLAGGRVTCGLGLGWYEHEHRAYAWDFPPTGDRYRLLEDALVALPRFWGPGAKPFEGRSLAFPETIGYPRPVQAHIPILVGGGGERTLGLAARYADAVNVMGPVDVVADKVAVLRRRCEDLGRDPVEVRITHLSPALLAADRTELRALVAHLRPGQLDADRYAASVNAATIEDHIERVGTLREVGVDEVIVALVDLGIPTPAALDPIDRYREVIAAFRTAERRR